MKRRTETHENETLKIDMDENWSIKMIVSASMPRRESITYTTPYSIEDITPRSARNIAFHSIHIGHGYFAGVKFPFVLNLHARERDETDEEKRLCGWQYYTSIVWLFSERNGRRSSHHIALKHSLTHWILYRVAARAPMIIILEMANFMVLWSASVNNVRTHKRNTSFFPPNW